MLMPVSVIVHIKDSPFLQDGIVKIDMVLEYGASRQMNDKIITEYVKGLYGEYSKIEIESIEW